MRWLWIDRILEFEPGRRLVAAKAVSLSEPHLHDHFAAGESGAALPVMPGPLILEGMAQAGGLLAGEARGFRDSVVLAKVKRADLAFDVLPGSVLLFEATLAAIDDAGASVDGVVWATEPGSADRTRMGAIDLMFGHVPAEDRSILLSEAFRTLVDASARAGGGGVSAVLPTA
ncbi:MAG: beta-hydroxyacyl-ACP dehydratase [Planctomycetota bacterium]